MGTIMCQKCQNEFHFPSTFQLAFKAGISKTETNFAAVSGNTLLLL